MEIVRHAVTEKAFSAGGQGRESFMKRGYSVIIEQDEAGYYAAEVPELYGCHLDVTAASAMRVSPKGIDSSALFIVNIKSFT